MAHFQNLMLFQLGSKEPPIGDAAQICNNGLCIEWFRKLCWRRNSVHNFLLSLKSFLPNCLKYANYWIAPLFGVKYQAAAKANVVFKSCEVMLTLNMRPKRCKILSAKKVQQPTSVAQPPLFWPQAQSSQKFMGFDTHGLRAD